MSTELRRGKPPGLVLRSGVLRYARAPTLQTNPGGKRDNHLA
jgi:hypothetical protein